MATGQTSPIAVWLRDLARTLHDELGGPGVGALGMCFTGGFALAMMVDPSVAAPVLAQPSLPFPVGKARAADLNLSPGDLAAVKQRAAGGCEVLGLRYRGDSAVGTRFETLTRELGDAFLRVDLDGKGHSTLTEHRSVVNPLGVKGVGESGAIPGAAAIANAIEDAVADLGVTIREVPVTPAHLHTLLAEARRH